jgi:hypothetical protein
MDNVPVYVPACKLVGSTLTEREVVENGATVPAEGETDSQLPPEFVAALTAKVAAEALVLDITTDWLTTEVDPCVREKVREAGFAATVPPEFPVMLMVIGKGKGPNVWVMPSNVTVSLKPTLTVKKPACVGVPEIVLEAIVRPGGRLPSDTVKLKEKPISDGIWERNGSMS